MTITADFDTAILQAKPENSFFRFCLLRRPSLIKYLPGWVLASIAWYFHGISRRAYLERKWAFLKGIPNLTELCRSFSGKKRMFFTEKATDVVSDMPECALYGMLYGAPVQIHANEYDRAAGAFKAFKPLPELAALAGGDVFYAGFGARAGRAQGKTVLVRGKRAFETRRAAAAHCALASAFTAALVAAFGAGVGLLSLYFAKAEFFGREMLFSYLTTKNLALLNILPVVLVLAFLYFVFNRLWAAFAATAGLTMVLTWISYFKLFFRNDPLYFEDLVLFKEAVATTESYPIALTWKFWAVIAFLALCTIALFFISRRRVTVRYVRPACAAGLAALSLALFFSVYQDSGVYSANENLGLINRWSATDQFVSRGFVYPFLHSASEVFSDKKPEGYSASRAEEILARYAFEGIPEDRRANFIFIMLEAYNDFSTFAGVEFETDPYRLWHELQSESLHGRLVTNIFGGGTVDTERRVMSGYTELPSFRKKTDTYVRFFASEGYFAEGLHPSNTWFYNRVNINKNIGFDRYYFLENYIAPKYGSEFRDDGRFTAEALLLFEQGTAAGEPYLAFHVTYQNHGPYSELELYTDVKRLKNKGYPAPDYNLIDNYLHGIADTNENLARLIGELRKSAEPVVVVLFGDHNPFLGATGYQTLGISMDRSEEQGFYNYYSTPYLVWSNEAAQALGYVYGGTGPDMSPEFLLPYALSLAGAKGSEFMQLSMDVFSRTPVVHRTGRVVENGALSDEMSDDAARLYSDFLVAQYYLKKNFD